jgi:hypothetical protein
VACNDKIEDIKHHMRVRYFQSCSMAVIKPFLEFASNRTKKLEYELRVESSDLSRRVTLHVWSINL